MWFDLSFESATQTRNFGIIAVVILLQLQSNLMFSAKQLSALYLSLLGICLVSIDYSRIVLIDCVVFSYSILMWALCLWKARKDSRRLAAKADSPCENEP